MVSEIRKRIVIMLGMRMMALMGMVMQMRVRMKKDSEGDDKEDIARSRL